MNDLNLEIKLENDIRESEINNRERAGMESLVKGAGYGYGDSSGYGDGYGDGAGYSSGYGDGAG